MDKGSPLFVPLPFPLLPFFRSWQISGNLEEKRFSFYVSRKDPLVVSEKNERPRGETILFPRVLNVRSVFMPDPMLEIKLTRRWQRLDSTIRSRKLFYSITNNFYFSLRKEDYPWNTFRNSWHAKIPSNSNRNIRDSLTIRPIIGAHQ